MVLVPGDESKGIGWGPTEDELCGNNDEDPRHEEEE
jgi:hypothetical protein